MVALSAYLIFPFLVADAVCAGNATARLRVDLISATFISGGVATFIQSTFGLRLAILHGASLAFLAPIQTYQVSLGECTAGDDTYVPEEEWHVKLATLSGSLMTACCVFVLIGATGAVGWFARHVGPITIVPLLTLIAISTVPTIEQKLSSHYMAIVELVLLIIFVVFLEDFQVPIPYFSWEKRKIAIARAPVFGQFPYLISLGIAWLICYILSSAAVISDDSPASTKRNETQGLIANAPWVKVPYPGEYGGFRVNTAVCLGFVAAVLSSVIENVASRVTVQLAGVLSVALGLFTKSAAILACIPDPLIGSILCLGMSMIAGVALSNLKVVNLSQTRNLAIMGLALLLGLVIPSHFTKSPIKTGNDTWDEVLNMLLTIQMLIGGLFAFLMDIMVPGASRKDRGLADDDDQEGAEFPLDGFALPDWVDRLAILHGTSLAFLAPIQAYQTLNGECTAGDSYVPEEEWQGRLATLSGSLMIACCVFILIGATGAVGWFARHVGPITIVPLLTLLAISTVPTIEEKLSSHYMAIVELVLLVVFVVFLEHVQVPIPYYSLGKRRMAVARTPLFGQFPYLLSLGIAWFICYILSSAAIISDDSPASTKRNETHGLIANAPWVKVPYPGEYGGFRVNTALCLGFVASVLSSVIENVGSYKMGARVSHQGNPPVDNVNRAVMVEGLGSMLAASLGVSTGVTTYAENIALLHITKVASRVTVQLAGVLSVALGLFTKLAAILACIPDPLIGSILCLGMSMIAGVALSNLKAVNLSQTRNLAIMGLALLLGLVVPSHFTKSPIRTGSDTWDEVLNMLLRIQMLIGGLFAFLMDNMVPGASRKDRGLAGEEEEAEFPLDGFALPDWVDSGLDKMPILRRLPFLPSKSHRAPAKTAAYAFDIDTVLKC
ncbi:unnamed protein product, partial [Mesorhabditis spiculigera]